MALKFAPVQESLEEMSAAGVRALLAALPDSQAIRTILMAELKAVRAGVEREIRTLRNLWYDVAKPALSKAGILNKTTRGNRPVEWADKVSGILGDLVEEGVTSYEEMHIVDGSRQRRVACRVVHPVADVELVGAHYPWVILFLEKDTLWPVVEDLASLYGVSAVSGGGQPSLACTENMLREIVRHPAYQKAQPSSIVILSLTDYDSAGYTIARSIFNQVLQLARWIPARQRGALEMVRHIPLGLLPEQLTSEQRQAKAYEPKGDGLEEWLAETGGVDGQPLGLELDALPVSKLRAMFAKGMEEQVDLEKRRDDLREAYVDLLACELLRPEFEAKRRALHEAVNEAGLWDEIQEAPIPPDLFSRAAVDGWSKINPVADTEIFDDYTARVQATMRDALAKLGQVQDPTQGESQT